MSLNVQLLGGWHAEDNQIQPRDAAEQDPDLNSDSGAPQVPGHERRGLLVPYGLEHLSVRPLPLDLHTLRIKQLILPRFVLHWWGMHDDNHLLTVLRIVVITYSICRFIVIPS